MEKGEYAAAALQGDEEALVARIEMEKRKMYGIAYSYLRSETEALEAIQETVCRVWRKKHTLRDPRLFTTWMIRILIRVCLDAQKKIARERPVSIGFLGTEGTAIAREELRDPAQIETADRMDMARAVAKLSPPLRMVVTLKYYRDMTVADIASLLEKPEGTVKTWLHKALKQLRRELGDDRLGKETGQYET